MSSDLHIGDSGVGALDIENGGSVTNLNGRIGHESGSTGSATVTGAGSTWTNSGSLNVGRAGEGTLNIESGGAVSNTIGRIGDLSTGVGEVTVSGSGASWTNSDDLYLGQAGEGTLNIDSGGMVTNSRGYIGYESGSIGNARVTGAGSTWTNSGNLFVGDSGTGTLDIESGGRVENITGYIGFVADSNGSVRVTGADSTWANSDNLTVGDSGTGTLDIENGGRVENTHGYIGSEAGGNGSVRVTGTGSTWANSGNLRVGDSGTGTLDIENGGRVENISSYIGTVSSGIGTVRVTGAGSTWANSGNLRIGYFSTGTLDIENGGAVSSDSSIIADGSGSNGSSVRVADTGSAWTISGDLAVGGFGTGTLDIENGGRVENTDGHIGTLNSGSVTVTGAGSTWTNSGDLFVGNDGTGTLNIGAYDLSDTAGTVTAARLTTDTGSGTVNFNQTDDITFAVPIEGNITLDQRGSGTTTLTGANTYSGGTRITGGTLVGNSDSLPGDIVNDAALVFDQADDGSFAGVISGSGTLNKTGAGRLTLTGTNTYSDGTRISNGTLRLNDGGSISHGATQMWVGDVAGQAGTLEIGADSSLASYRSYIGNGGTGSVTVSGTGAQWQITEHLYTGLNSQGSLDIRAGGTVDVASVASVGNNSGVAGTVTVDGTGSVFQTGGTLTVGDSGTGTLTLQNGGTARVDGGSGTVVMGRGTGSSGILNFGAYDLGAATTAGSLEADTIRIGTNSLSGGGSGTINFNQTDTLTLAVDIDQAWGTGSVNQRGTGTTILTGTNNYNGDTTITDGKLLVNGSITGSGVIVNGGALGGSGTVGNVTVNSAGNLGAGNSAGTLTMAGDLSLAAGSVTTFELDTPNVVGSGVNDLIAVDGNLSLDGQLSIVPQASFDEGDYTLFTYGGSQTGAFDSLDGVSVAWEYALDYGSGSNGAVTLGITAAAGQYWDGANITANDSVDGGTGAWDATTGNWTSSSGDNNAAWDGSLAAIFSGTAGSITIADGYSAEAPALSFLTDGYEIAADGSGALALTDSATVEVLADNATISAPIRGTAGLDKTGSGTLILVGANTYTGGTRVSAGMLTGDTTSLQGDILNNAALTFDQATDGAFADSISGSGSLSKTGAGTLTLSGINTYTGATTVVDGMLVVDGSIVSPLTLESGSSLGGSGTLGDLTVASGATVAPGNSIGTLNVGGDWTLASGAIYEVELIEGGNTAGTHNDLVDVGGTATVEDGALIHVTPENGTDDGTTYADNTTYTIVEADGGLTVNGDQTLTDDYAYLDFTTSHDANNYYLTSSLMAEPEPEPDVEPGPDSIQSFCLPGMTANQCNTGDAAFTLNAGHDVYDQVLNMSDAQARAALTGLSGELHASSRALLVQQSSQLRQATLNRLHTTEQSGDTGGAWFDLLGGETTLDGDQNTGALDADDNGLLIGADTRLDNDWRLGFFTGYSRGEFELETQADSGEASNTHLGLYGAQQWNALSLNLGLSYSRHGLDTERRVLGQTLQADYDIHTLQGLAEAGYRIPLGGSWVQPFASAALVEQDRERFEETGGSAALHGDNDSATTGFTTLGLRGGTSLSLGGLPLDLYGSVGWRHAYDDTVPESQQRFADGSSLSFTIDGAPLARNSAQVETGVQVQLSDRASVNVNYRGEFSSDSDEQSLSAQFNIAF